MGTLVWRESLTSIDYINYPCCCTQRAPDKQGSTGGQTSNGFPLTAAATAAGIFTQNGQGTGPGAILNSDGVTTNSAAHPATRGTPIVIYMTGEGQTSPQGIDGKVTTAPYPAPLLPVAVTIGGQPATVQFINYKD